MKISIIILLTLTIAMRHAYGQAPLSVEISRMEFRAKQIAPPAPEAAELGKYGNVPVSLFTGTPNISVPLYELKGQSLSLPISLSYNSSGFKPEEPATWVGLGWSLNAGGVISRAVKGNPDVESNYFGPGKTLTIPISTDIFAWQDFMKDVKRGTRELETDWYYCNFAGHTAKFTILPDKTILKKEKDNLVIAWTSYPNTFTITDENGVVYTFSDVEQTHMELADDAQQDAPIIRYYDYNSSWYLTQMVSADGSEKILFTYMTTAMGPLAQNMVGNKSVSFTTSTRMANPPVYSETIDGFYPSPPTVTAKRKFLQSISLERNGSRIASVTLTSASLRLDSDFPGDQRLTSIKISGRKAIKQYDFGYNYFGSGSGAKRRLRLDTLREVATEPGTVSPPPYLFEYKALDNPPARFTTALDHWGYYKGNGPSLVPTFTFPNGIKVGDGATRDPDFNLTVQGMLSKITYPTGGYTTFAYEQHNARKGPMNIPIGGLRIKEIIDFSYQTKAAIQKTYSYLLDDGYFSSGKCDESFPRYDNKTTYHKLKPLITLPGTEEILSTIYTVSSNSIYGLGQVQGSHIGYSQVTEYQRDFTNGQSLGKTVYNYHLGTIYHEDDDIRNGDLEKKTVYDNGGKVLSELSNTYAYLYVGNVYEARIKPKWAQDNRTAWCKEPTPGGGYDFVGYTQATFPSGCADSRTYYQLMYDDGYGVGLQQRQLIKQVQRTYDPLTGGYLVNTRKMTYGNPNHTFPTQIEDYTTGAEELITRKKYAGDYTGVNGNTAGISTLVSKNMLGTEIESIQIRQDTTGTNKRLINGKITYYENNTLPTKLFRFESPTPPTTWTESSWGTSGFVMDSRYKPLAGFAYLNNTLVEQSKEKDAVQSYLWDKVLPSPIATITNSSSKWVVYSSFENVGNIAGDWITSGTTANTTLAYTGRKSLNLEAAGNISFTQTTALNKPSIVSYWSRTGALTLTQNNTTNIPIAFTGPVRNGWTFYLHKLPAGTSQVKLAAANGIIDEVKWYPSDAQVTTYTYENQVGITSMTTPDNLTTYYEYDGMNRLINIKDEKGNIRQNMAYNYGPGTPLTASAQTLFYNNVASQIFTRNTCTAGEPSAEMYTIPYGKYVSVTSQAEVDAKAQADITANGQTYANTVGLCWFYNVEAMMRFVSSKCYPDLGKFYKYIVPARKWRSTVSQAAADQLAQDDITANGQAAADLYGECACSAEGRKFINGVCQTGDKFYVSSVYQGPGDYLCTYKYSWSDGTYSQAYTEHSTTNCVNL